MRNSYKLYASILFSGILIIGFGGYQTKSTELSEESIQIITQEGEIVHTDRFKIDPSLSTDKEVVEDDSDEIQLVHNSSNSIEEDVKEDLLNSDDVIEDESEKQIKEESIAELPDELPQTKENSVTKENKTERAETHTESVQEEDDTTELTESPSEIGIKEFNGKSRLNVTHNLLPLKNSAIRTEKLTHVVLHFTSNALNKPEDPYQLKDTYDIFSNYGVSAHYVIDRSGQIYLFVDEERIAYHAGKGDIPALPNYKDSLNKYSLGIELLAIGTREEMIPIVGEDNVDLIDESLFGYTEAQYSSLNNLLSDITERHPHVNRNRTHIVGHDEYSSGRKTDPGKLFNWSRIGL